MPVQVGGEGVGREWCLFAYLEFYLAGKWGEGEGKIFSYWNWAKNYKQDF